MQREYRRHANPLHAASIAPFVYAHARGGVEVIMALLVASGNMHTCVARGNVGTFILSGRLGLNSEGTPHNGHHLHIPKRLPCLIVFGLVSASSRVRLAGGVDSPVESSPAEHEFVRER